ncbi:MAG TPA: VOC family protein [Hyphomonadaceae bacterium]|nr:VOC family protein [Hyphomonadaceae bacterium]
MSVQKISPFLMFNGPVEEAARFYASVFPNSDVKSANPMQATVVLAGLEVSMFNGGPHFSFSEGMSLFVKCKDQAEVDKYWNAFLGAGGKESKCGWLKDKWGVSWQIIPDALGRYLGDPDRNKANRVLQAMMKMQKIIVADLDAAAAA